MPSKALGRRGKRSRPPLTMVSVVSASLTSVVVKIEDEKLIFKLLFDDIEELMEDDDDMKAAPLFDGVVNDDTDVVAAVKNKPRA